MDMLPEPEEGWATHSLSHFFFLLSQQIFSNISEEDDMLDLAACLKENSRLGDKTSPCNYMFLAYVFMLYFCIIGCQIILKKEMEGMVLTLPPSKLSSKLLN